jgi:hypothetical protein
MIIVMTAASPGKSAGLARASLGQAADQAG